MLPEKMPVQQSWIHRLRITVQLVRMQSHLGDFLKHDRIMYRLVRISPPCERRMAMNQNARHAGRIDSALTKRFDDDVTRLQLISPLDLRIRHSSRTRDFPVKVVGVRRPKCRDRPSCLGPASRPRGMGVYNAADLRERLV